jgi:aminoglycoside phosphotransferase family enzyme
MLPFDQERLISLSKAIAYPDKPEHVEMLETHTFRVFLAGRFAYKMRKPIGPPGQIITYRSL